MLPMQEAPAQTPVTSEKRDPAAAPARAAQRERAAREVPAALSPPGKPQRGAERSQRRPVLRRTPNPAGRTPQGRLSSCAAWGCAAGRRCHMQRERGRRSAVQGGGGTHRGAGAGPRVPSCLPERRGEGAGPRQRRTGAGAAAAGGARRASGGCGGDGDMRTVSTWCREARVILGIYPPLDPHQRNQPPRQSTGKAARLRGQKPRVREVTKTETSGRQRPSPAPKRRQMPTVLRVSGKCRLPESRQSPPVQLHAGPAKPLGLGTLCAQSQQLQSQEPDQSGVRGRGQR